MGPITTLLAWARSCLRLHPLAGPMSYHDLTQMHAPAGMDAFLLESIFRPDVWDFMCEPVSEDNERAVCDTMIQVGGDVIWVGPSASNYMHSFWWASTLLASNPAAALTSDL